MATLKVFSCSFLFLLCVAACKEQDWCIVSYNISASTMRHLLDDACKKLDCSAVKPGGDCYHPDTLVNHVSYVLNLKYRATKICPAGVALKVIQDPSYDKCKYT